MGSEAVSLPAGFTLDQPAGLPEGFKLDPPKEPSAMDKLKSIGLRNAKAFAWGGPLGMVASNAFNPEGQQAFEKFAYDAGGTITDTVASHSGKHTLFNPLGVDISPETSAAVGAVGTAGLNAIPMLIGGGGVGKAAAPIMESGAKWVAQSALKPTSLSLANGDAAKAITTMLQEGISVTASGAAELRRQITKLKGEIGNLIEQSTGTVDKGYAASEIYKTLEKFRKQANPGADVDAVMKSWQEFNQLVGAKIPVQEAQAIKQGTQRILKESYDKVKENPASTQTQQAIASGLRQGIEDAVPGVGEKNAIASRLINALQQIEPRAAMQMNKDLFGLAALGHSMDTAALMLADRNPWIKSLLAHVLYRGREAVPGGVAATGIAGYEAANRPK